MKNNKNLSEPDLAVLWHPCTQMKDHEQLPIIPIKKGQGVWLEDFNDNRYLDAISFWWVYIFGHVNAQINQTVTLGNVINFMQPYVISEQEFKLMTDVVWEGFQLASRD